MVKKDSTHPFYGKGSEYGYAIDQNGSLKQGDTLKLRRNQPYEFTVISSSQHPLFFSTNAVGGGTPERLSPVSGVVTNVKIPDPNVKSFTATFDQTAPSSFYYACGLHPYMGGIVQLS